MKKKWVRLLVALGFLISAGALAACEVSNVTIGGTPPSGDSGGNGGWNVGTGDNGECLHYEEMRDADGSTTWRTGWRMDNSADWWRTEPTCTEDAYKEHYICDFCGAYSLDGNTVVDESEWIIPALGHDYEERWDADNDTHSKIKECQRENCYEATFTESEPCTKYRVVGRDICAVCLYGAKENSKIVDGVYYVLSDDETYYKVSGQMSDGKKLTIQATVEGLPVTEIDGFGADGEVAPAFETIDIPDSVKTIRMGAFANCKNLKSITIPNTVTKIYGYAFQACTGLETVTFEEGSTLTSIGGGRSDTYQGVTFMGCESLKSITIPQSVTSLEDYMFSGCTDLQEVIFEEGNKLNYIGDYAFSRCASLQKLGIPDSVTEMGHCVFQDCGVTDLTIPFIGERADGKGSNGNLYWLFFNSYSGALALPQGLKLTVTGGTHLTSDSFGNYCGGMEELILPDTITAIASGALQYCTGLKSVSLPFIGNNANDTVNTSFSYIFGGEDKIPQGLKNVTLTGGENIADNAFKNCAAIERIVLPDGLKSIGASAFEGCAGLTSLYIGSSVTTLGERAFAGCAGLVEVTFENPELYENAENVFESCNAALTVTLHYIEMDNGRYYYNADGLVFKNVIDTTASYIFIKDGTVKVREDALKGCNNLRFAYVPDSVTYADDTAFVCEAPRTFTLFAENRNATFKVGAYTSVNLETAATQTVPYLVVTGVKYADGYVYGAMDTASTSAGQIWAYIGEDTDVVVPTWLGSTEITGINGYAFIDSKIQSITLHERIVNIGGVTTKATDGYEYMYYATPFSGSAVKEVIFVNPTEENQGAATVYPYAFLEANALERVTFAENATAIISTDAFYKCTALKTVSLSTWTLVMPKAFEGCTGLKNVNLSTKDTFNSMPATTRNICTVTVNGTQLTVDDRTAIDERVYTDSAELAKYMLENSDRYFEFGFMLLDMYNENI